MARNVSSEAFVKKNSKFEAFLKRNLDEESFQRVRAYEACIVVSEKEDKAFKYVVLDNEWIYLTENPPKKIQSIVHLHDVVSVKLETDFPDFLQGEERENTQHLVIRYLTNAPPKKKVSLRRKNRSSVKSNNGSLTDRDSGYYTENDVQRSSPNPALQRSLKGSGKGSLQFRALVTPRASTSSPLLEELENEPRRRSSLDSSLTQALLQENGKSQEKKNGKKLANSMPSSGLSKLCMCRSVKEGPSNKSLQRLDRENPSKSGSSGSPSVPALKSSLHNNPSDCPDNRDYSDTQTDLSIPIGRLIESGQLNGQALGSDEMRETELHLYILNRFSPILMLTQYAKSNYLISGTLQQDADLLDKTMTLTARSMMSTARSLNSSEKLPQLFSQLKQELLNASKSMEDVFSLMQELHTATERNPTLKKLFWKTPDLFIFCVTQLQQYLPKSKVNMNCIRGRHYRADELELVVEIVQLLALMFRETDTLISRLNAVTSGHGKATQDLLSVLVCAPEIPEKHFALTGKAAALLRRSQVDEELINSDEEIAELVEEFTNAATTGLFELILTAKQSGWGSDQHSFFTVDWVFSNLDASISVETFLSHTVTSMMKLLTPANHNQLSPTDAVSLFQQMSLLHTVTEHSAALTEFVRNNFIEEFKYFIQGPVIHMKLPDTYPISLQTIQMIEKVMSLILQKKTVLLPH